MRDTDSQMFQVFGVNWLFRRSEIKLFNTYSNRSKTDSSNSQRRHFCEGLMMHCSLGDVNPSFFPSLIRETTECEGPVAADKKQSSCFRFSLTVNIYDRSRFMITCATYTNKILSVRQGGYQIKRGLM
ncbi:hypothetical protein TNCV_4771431 [Trichonephila clavipes]|nr:hypothetical protein TNCV_4771431 [Trichonephila clavipes]